MSDVLSSLQGLMTPQVALGGAGLGYDILRGSQLPKGANQVLNQAGALTTQGNQMLQQGLNGQLPVGAQAQLNQGTNSGEATIRQNYASMGLTGSTMEAQALQGIQQQRLAETQKMAHDFITTGMKMAGMGVADYETIMKMNVQQDDEIIKAIGSFASAFGGGR